MSNPEDVFGIAHVDGKYYLTKEDYLNEGADQVLATGSKVIKLYLSPKSYRWNSDWPKNTHGLVDVAKSLSRPEARRIAYKVAFAMALSDFGTSDDEVDFGDALLQVLGLSSGDADELESEVYAALDEVQ